MSNNPNFLANWDSRLILDPELEEATEANQVCIIMLAYYYI